MASRIDVSIERRGDSDADGGKPHPNTCPSCGSHYRDDELAANLHVCPHCGHHFPVRARERVAQLTVEGALVVAEVATSLGDAILSGTARIHDHPCELAVMDFAFMGGSMGSAVGERFARACERAAEAPVPLVSVTASGGARMQEGILSLMQMPKTVCAVDALRESRCAFISVMTHPTTAGVLASFASLGDVIVAEPGALVSFTGPRVVQQTTREKLPEDFGLAEQNARFGHVDAIVPRPELRTYLERLLRLFANVR
jgi:acetyl-CoA carboxylase carboxyl transferase subunit beta